LFDHVPLFDLAGAEHLLLSVPQLAQVGFSWDGVIELLDFAKEDGFFIGVEVVQETEASKATHSEQSWELDQLELRQDHVGDCELTTYSDQVFAHGLSLLIIQDADHQLVSLCAILFQALVSLNRPLHIVETDRQFLFLLESFDLIFWDPWLLGVGLSRVKPSFLGLRVLRDDHLVRSEELKEADQALLAQVFAWLTWHHLCVG